jgi:hypothetical protein
MRNYLKGYSLFDSIVALFFIVLSTCTLYLLFQIPMWVTAPTLFVLSFYPSNRPSNYLFDMVYRSAYTGEMRTLVTGVVKDSFLDGITDYSSKVTDVGNEAQVIHIGYMGVMPDVLINNTTYPIAIQDLPIEDLVIILDKYQTKQTPISDDELYAATSSKREGVIKLHGMAIATNKMRKSIHALAPTGNTNKMPVLLTTGADDGTGRKRATWEDISRLKQQLDNLEVPEDVRRLVLCSDHMNDLCLIDQKFKDAYYNRATGKPYSQLGFDIRDHLAAPYFHIGTKAKLSYGAVPTSNHFKATTFFRTDMAAKATGWTKMYYSAAEQNPGTQTNHMNWRHYFITLPLMEEGRAAVVSDKVV